MKTSEASIDHICSLFASRQWTDCLNHCSNLELSKLKSEDIPLYFIIYLRTILSLKSDKNSAVWNMIKNYYQTISKIPVQLCIVEIHILVSLNQPKTASDLCSSLYFPGCDPQILEIHLFSVIIPNSLMAFQEISEFVKEKSQIMEIDVNSIQSRVEELIQRNAVKYTPWQICKKYLSSKKLMAGLVLILLLILLKRKIYKYKTS